jgi:hypothetical protein
VRCGLVTIQVSPGTVLQRQAHGLRPVAAATAGINDALPAGGRVVALREVVGMARPPSC